MGDKFVNLALTHNVKGILTVGCALACAQICATGIVAITEVAVTAATNAIKRNAERKRNNKTESLPVENIAKKN